MPFDIKQQRDQIEQQYIGFSPNTTSVKPVHLANGMFRTILGARYPTKRLFHFVFTTKTDGTLPNKNHELGEVYKALKTSGHMDASEIDPAQLAKLRSALRKIVAADGAVSTSKMESYSAGYAAFASEDRIAQDAGEFLAIWLQRTAPNFTNLILTALNQPNDPITLLAFPLLSTDAPRSMNALDPENIRPLSTACPAGLRAQMDVLARAAQQLTDHMDRHPNKLSRLRMALLLSGFLVVRYLTDLERAYDPSGHARRVFLLDFSTEDKAPVRIASQRSYVLLCQSIARFYSWMFADYLRSLSEADLVQVPTYGKKTKPTDQQLYQEVWQAAHAEKAQASDPYRVLGQAIYNILALQAEATPIQYLRQLGIRSGLFWPPYNLQPTKQLTPRQDMLEVLIRGVVAPDELIDLAMLQDRLWQSYGIIIGGRPDDLDILLDAGIYQADSRALEENQAAFAHSLHNLNFARVLADGVLEVKGGAVWN